MCVKNKTIIYEARASNSKRDCEHDLYCCLLPRCEALRTCRSGFPIATPPRFKVPAQSDPVKRWNFRKADWKRFCFLKGESVKKLPPPDTPDIDRAYQNICEYLLSAAKQYIPRGRRKNYVPCWDKECENLYRSFIRAPVGTASDRAASSLLSRLQQKKQER